MIKRTYTTPKVEVLKLIRHRQNLLTTFSISGNIEDYEGTEDEDF